MCSFLLILTPRTLPQAYPRSVMENVKPAVVSQIFDIMDWACLMNFLAAIPEPLFTLRSAFGARSSAWDHGNNWR